MSREYAAAFNLRQARVRAVTEALLSHEWTPGRPTSQHREHVYHGDCAVCIGDLTQMIPVVLDAADAARGQA